MKRLVICLTIIAIIIAVGLFAVAEVNAKNDRLYGKIDAVLEAYDADGDVRGEIAGLTEYFEKEYAAKLSIFVDDKLLGEMLDDIVRLEPMLDSDCDEFKSECEALRAGAQRIYLSEVPSLFRIL